MRFPLIWIWAHKKEKMKNCSNRTNVKEARKWNWTNNQRRTSAQLLGILLRLFCVQKMNYFFLSFFLYFFSSKNRWMNQKNTKQNLHVQWNDILRCFCPDRTANSRKYLIRVSPTVCVSKLFWRQLGQVAADAKRFYINCAHIRVGHTSHEPRPYFCCCCCSISQLICSRTFENSSHGEEAHTLWLWQTIMNRNEAMVGAWYDANDKDATPHSIRFTIKCLKR